MFQNVYFWACEAGWRWRLIVAVSRVKGLVDSKVTVPTVSQARHEVLQNLTHLETTEQSPSKHDQSSCPLLLPGAHRDAGLRLFITQWSQ